MAIMENLNLEKYSPRLCKKKIPALSSVPYNCQSYREIFKKYGKGGIHHQKIFYQKNKNSVFKVSIQKYCVQNLKDRG